MAYIVREEDTSMALPAADNFKSFLVSGEDPNLVTILIHFSFFVDH
jgi:hypothetical protein